MEIVKDILRFLIHRKKAILYLLISFLVLSILVFSDYGILKKYDLQSQNKAIIRQTEEQKKLKDSLQLRVQLITNDKTEIERAARKYYGLIKPKENVYIIRHSQSK